MSAKIDKLSKKVLEFVIAQPEYDPQQGEKIHVFFEDKRNFIVIYGKTETTGIMGCGTTVGQAFEDFVLSWNEVKAFKSKKRNR
jgi:hypothetical protein